MNENYITIINEMLLNFREKEIQSKIFGKTDEQYKFLRHCINCLETYERDLITSIMIDKISIRNYARKTGFSRSFIAKERDRIIILISKFFQIRYSYRKKAI